MVQAKLDSNILGRGKNETLRHSLPSNPPAIINTYQSGLCLHPKMHYEIAVCKGFLDGIPAGRYDLQNGNSYSGNKFIVNPPKRFGLGYGVGYWDGYNYIYNSTNHTYPNYTVGNMTAGNMRTEEEPIQQQQQQPFSSLPSPQQRQSRGNGINWGEVCRSPLVDLLITEPCDTLTTPDGYTLTPEGECVIKCLAGGAALLLYDPSGTTLGAAKTLGPALSCGDSGGFSNPGPDRGNILDNILGKLLGRNR